MSSQEARLNLVISAQDKASKVIESFVSDLKRSFEKINQALKDAINPKVLTEATKDAVNGVNRQLHGINENIPKDAFDKIAQAAFKTRKELEADFERVKEKFKNAALEQVQAAELTTAQLKKIVQAADEARKPIETYRNKFKESFDTIKNTSFRTREQLVEDFHAIKQGLGESALKSVDAAQLTTAQLRKIVEAAQEVKVEVVKDMNAAASSMEKAAEASQHMAKVADFDSLEYIGQELMYFGQQATGFFVGAIKDAADFEQSVVNTKASLVALGESVKNNGKYWDQLKSKALDLGNAGFFSANQVAEAMNVLARQGIHSKEIVEGAIKTVHDVAAANQEDLADTANVVSDIYHQFHDQLMKEFNGDIPRIFQEIGDAISGATHHARMSMTDFLNTMKYVGPQAEQLGWNVKDTATAIALLAQSGIRGSQTGTALRRMLTNIIPTTKKAKEAFDELGWSGGKFGSIFIDASGKAKPFTEIAATMYETLHKMPPIMQEMGLKTIFGQYALSGMTAAAKKNREQLMELLHSVSKTGLSTDMLKEKQEGLGFVLQRLQAQYETFKKEVGDALEPVVRKVAGALKVLLDWFHGLSPGMKQTIVMFTAIGAVVTVVAGAFLTFVGIIGGLAVAVPAGIEALAAVGPIIGIVAAAIAGVIAVVALLKKAWETDFGHIREKTHAVWTWIKQQFNSAMSVVKQTVQDGIQTVKKWWDKIGPDAEKALHRVYQAVVALKPLWEGAWEGIKFVVKLVWDAVVDTIRHAWNVVSGIFQLIVHLINGDWKKAWEDLKQIVWNAVMLAIDFFKVKWLGAFAKGLLESVLKLKWFRGEGLDLIKNFIKGAEKFIDDMWTAIKKIFKDATEAIKSAVKKWLESLGDLMNAFSDLAHGNFKDFWKNLKSAAKNGVDAILDLIKGWFDVMDTLYGGLPKKALKWAKDKMDAFIKGIKDGYAGVKDAITSLINKIDDMLGNLPSKALKWARNMISQFASGILDFGPVKRAVDSVTQWISDHLGHHSPPKEGIMSDDDKWMPRMIRMFAEGIEATRPELARALEKVAMEIKLKLDPFSDKNKGESSTNNPFMPKIMDRLKDVHHDILAKLGYFETHDPYLHPSSNTDYDRINHHLEKYSPQRHDHIRLGTRHQRPNVNVHINIEGRSAETDRHLTRMIQDRLERLFRSHLPMQTPH